MVYRHGTFAAPRKLVYIIIVANRNVNLGSTYSI